MTTAYPGGIDDFAEASPTYMSDPDSTGRTHDSRHDDVESAVEAIEKELGVNPSGDNATVAERVTGLSHNVDGAYSVIDVALVVNPTATGKTALNVTGEAGNKTWIDLQGAGNNYHDARSHNFGNMAGTTHTRLDENYPTFYGREIPTAWQDNSVGRRIFIWDRTNSRWQMVYGDTGWRNISSLFLNGWTGTLSVRRINNTTWWHMEANGTAATNVKIVTPPPGFGPVTYAQYLQANAGNQPGGLYFGANELTVMYPASPWGWIYMTAAGLTDSPWPSSLPGTAAGTIPTLLPGDDPSRGSYDPDADVDPEIPTGLRPGDTFPDAIVDYPEGPTP